MEVKDDEASGVDEDAAHLLTVLARNIRFFRGQRGMTRKCLAAQSGVSLPHLARLEGGQGNVSVVVLGKIAKALNQPMCNLFAENESAHGDLAIIVEFLKRQPPQKLTRIREYLLTSPDLLRTGKADRVALIGLRGAGKSTIGRKLADRLGRPFIELNREVEREAGLSLQEIINFYGQAGYRNLERRCLEQIVSSQPQVVLATGGGIVSEPLTYEILLTFFFTVWLHADPEIHFKRVMDQHDIRIAKPTMYQEAMDNIVRTLETREHLYQMADCDVDTSSLTIQEVLDRVAVEALVVLRAH